MISSLWIFGSELILFIFKRKKLKKWEKYIYMKFWQRSIPLRTWEKGIIPIDFIFNDLQVYYYQEDNRNELIFLCKDKIKLKRG